MSKPKPKTAEQIRFEKELKRILLSEEERQKVGYGWLAEYKEELDDFLLAQYHKTKSQIQQETAQKIFEEIGVWIVRNYRCPNIPTTTMKDCPTCEYQFSCELGKIFTCLQQLKERFGVK